MAGAMSNFFRFPHTPHLAWLGKTPPRDDKLLAPNDVEALLSGSVVVEEKIDGANLGLSFSQAGEVCVQNRGAYLQRPYQGQFSRLDQWLVPRVYLFQRVLYSTDLPDTSLEKSTTNGDDLILFGEWCAARHSLDYDALPDWFVLFDVYDRSAQRFWSVKRRNELAHALELSVVPLVFEGKASLEQLKVLVMQLSSRYRVHDKADINHRPQAEGIVVRKDDALWCQARAKLVHPDFAQAIGEHWRQRPIDWNTCSADKYQGDSV